MHFSHGVEVELLLLMCIIMWCGSVRLSPLENNDKLQDISNLYVAEWQWESWPVKQELLQQESRLPGQRKNVALWRDISKSAWYLFGGQPINGDPKKVYSDVWKFTVKTRVWKRFFPSQTEMKDATVTLRSNHFVESNISYFKPLSQKAVLCGGLGKKNTTNIQWNSFRRKMSEEEKNKEELTYLAVFAPKALNSNTVWQIDLKDKLWKSYVCDCNSNEKEIKNLLINSSKGSMNKTKMPNLNETLKNNLKEVTGKNFYVRKNVCTVLNSKINNAEDETDDEQQHLNINNLKNKKKKINQVKKSNDKPHLKKVNIAKRGNASNFRRKERSANETKLSTSGEVSNIVENKTAEHGNDGKVDIEKKKEEHVLKLKNISGYSEGKIRGEKLERIAKLKAASKNCPEFREGETLVTWCDGRNEAYVSWDVGSPEINLWVFKLRTNRWSQLQVRVFEGVKWPGCSNLNSVRYAGNEEEVYLICSQSEKQFNTSNKSFQNSTDPSEVPSDSGFNTKLVYRINYKERVLRSLGKIRLSSYFGSVEGENVWQNETQSILQVFKNSENETILILAYLDMVDLWILNRDQENNESFDLIEKVWRGSALKWFDKYNAALYSLQFVSESGSSETILLPNPRNIGAHEYWPRERGRFIIRVFRNENLKNQNFENRTREHNLTYELLQSDFKASGAEHQLNHLYSLKVIVFFGISLVIFTVFGFVIFLKRCVNCPPRIRIRSECHKSPLVIRYSVIPDDLLYPVA